MKMHLSDRQKQIIKLLADGFSQKEISGKLKISKTNTNNYLSKARAKTGARTTVHLVMMAKENKIIA